MFISAIITTYNQPDWLEKVLWGFSAQTFRDFEIVIADDGSEPATAQRIERLRSAVNLPIEHVWHEHRGFRKCEVLNKSIVAAQGEYLFFTDGDCIPRRDLLEVHRRLAAPGRFLSGGYLKLPMETSRLISRDDILEGRATDARWLHAHGTPLTRRLMRLSLGENLGRLADALTPTRASFNGHNSSAWKSDVVAANGFDERLAYGGLDRELGERLENAGIRGKQIRNRAFVVHLDHSRGYRDTAAWQRNFEIRRETVATRRTRAVVGLSRHLTGPHAGSDRAREQTRPAS